MKATILHATTNAPSTIRPLPKEIRRDGSRLVQAWREGDIAIYEGEHRDEGGLKYWETIRVRASKPHPRSTESWALVELYPGDEHWGVGGFTYRDKERAMAKARELQEGPSLHVGRA